MPKPVLCAICNNKIPYGTINTDIQFDHPRFGQHRPGQSTDAGRFLHVACVEEAGTVIPWHHLWLSNIRIRSFIEDNGLMGQDIALCSRCHEVLSEQIVGNYRAMERFDEGARLLEEFGRAEEDPGFSRVSRRPTPSWPRSRARFYGIALLFGRAWGLIIRD